MKYKHIIWDWNGTVVDDVELSVEVLNSILKHKELPTISLECYRNSFSFPVSDFYESLGIKLTLEESERLGKIFMAEYNAKRFGCPLHDGVESLMEKIEENSVGQSILSAYHKNYLLEAAAHYNISRFMTNIAGLEDIRAETKVALGKKLISELDTEPSKILIVGDTDHDLAVARATGADAMLITRGHQSEERLKKTGAKTFSDYHELKCRIFP